MRSPFPTPRKNLIFSFLSIVLLISISQIAMADSSESIPSSGEAAVHIVFTEQPPSNEEPEAFHVRTLASVLGSEEAAKSALLYSYKTAARGFSAKLTPEQVAEISKQPGVLQVLKSETVQLHSASTTGSLC